MFSPGSKCNNKEYTVLEGSAGKKKNISNKGEAKQFKNGKQLALKTAKTRDGKLRKTAMTTVWNAPFI